MLQSILSNEERISLMVKQESSEDYVNDRDQQQQEQPENPSLLDDGVVNNEWNITGDTNTVASQASATFTEEF